MYTFKLGCSEHVSHATLGAMISLEVMLSLWSVLATRRSRVSTSDGRHGGSGKEDLLRRHWERTLSKIHLGYSSLSSGLSDFFAFTVSIVIAVCLISSSETVFSRSSISSPHEFLEGFGFGFVKLS